MAAKGVTGTSSSVRAVAGPGQPIHHWSQGIAGPPPSCWGHTLPHATAKEELLLTERKQVFKEFCYVCWFILLLINNQSSWVSHWCSCYEFNTKAEVFGLLPPTPSPTAPVTSVSFSSGKGQLLHLFVPQNQGAPR